MGVSGQAARTTGRRGQTHSLGDVVDNDGAVGVAVVHGCQRLVALLAGRVPDFKLDRRALVEGDGLGEEGSADGGFPVVIELVLQASQRVVVGGWGRGVGVG